MMYDKYRINGFVIVEYENTNFVGQDFDALYCRFPLLRAEPLAVRAQNLRIHWSLIFTYSLACKSRRTLTHTMRMHSTLSLSPRARRFR